MNDSSQRSDAEALEAHIRAITEAADRAAALLRALAPLRSHLAALDAAVAMVGIPAPPAPDQMAALASAASSPAADDEVVNSYETPITPDSHELRPAGDNSAWTELSPLNVQSGVPAATSSQGHEPAVIGLMAVANAGGEVNGSSAQRGAHLGRTATVTVTREDAPLDLVRVHSALDQVQGVTSLALVSYTRGRAVLQIEADRPIVELQLSEGLCAAFPEGVTTHRQSPDDIVMSIGTL